MASHVSPTPPILVDPATARAVARSGEAAGAKAHTAWKWVGWFGFVLLLVSLSDLALTWIPFELGRPEWEFGTVAASFAGLPLLAMGMAGVVASGLAFRRGWIVWPSVALMVILGVAMIAATGIFLLDVPLALRLAPVEVQVGIKKTIVKTLIIGTLFPIAFLSAAVAVGRYHASRSR